MKKSSPFPSSPERPEAGQTGPGEPSILSGWVRRWLQEQTGTGQPPTLDFAVPPYVTWVPPVKPLLFLQQIDHLGMGSAWSDSPASLQPVALTRFAEEISARLTLLAKRPEPKPLQVKRAAGTELLLSNNVKLIDDLEHRPLEPDPAPMMTFQQMLNRVSQAPTGESGPMNVEAPVAGVPPDSSPAPGEPAAKPAPAKPLLRPPTFSQVQEFAPGDRPPPLVESGPTETQSDQESVSPAAGVSPLTGTRPEPGPARGESDRGEMAERPPLKQAVPPGNPRFQAMLNRIGRARPPEAAETRPTDRPPVTSPEQQTGPVKARRQSSPKITAYRQARADQIAGGHLSPAGTLSRRPASPPWPERKDQAQPSASPTADAGQARQVDPEPHPTTTRASFPPEPEERYLSQPTPGRPPVWSRPGPVQPVKSEPETEAAEQTRVTKKSRLLDRPEQESATFHNSRIGEKLPEKDEREVLSLLEEVKEGYPGHTGNYSPNQAVPGPITGLLRPASRIDQWRPPLTVEQATRHLISRGWRFKGGRTTGSTPSPPAEQGVTRLAEGSDGGRPLPTGPRSMMERTLGRDFSRVRLHTVQLAPLDVQAATRGPDVYLKPGHDRLNRPASIALLGHELTHVVQQGFAGPAVQRAILPQPRWSVGRLEADEAEAERNERHILDLLKNFGLDGQPDQEPEMPFFKPEGAAEEASPAQAETEPLSPPAEALPFLPVNLPVPTGPAEEPSPESTVPEAGRILQELLDSEELPEKKEPDLKQLAQKLYPLLKRRLALERQQMPG